MGGSGVGWGGAVETDPPAIDVPVPTVFKVGHTYWFQKRALSSRRGKTPDHYGGEVLAADRLNIT